MRSTSEVLREAVASLSEAEAAKALDYIRRLRADDQDHVLRDLLSGDPAIHAPDKPFAPLPPVEPVRGAGIPASELLVRDRR
jgi:hypothetical protein